VISPVERVHKVQGSWNSRYKYWNRGNKARAWTYNKANWKCLFTDGKNGTKMFTLSSKKPHCKIMQRK
jgi:hypothetical protein